MQIQKKKNNNLIIITIIINEKYLIIYFIKTFKIIFYHFVFYFQCFYRFNNFLSLLVTYHIFFDQLFIFFLERRNILLDLFKLSIIKCI